METKSIYKIAVADDEALFRKGLDMLINDHDRLKTHIMAADGRDLLDQLKANSNDLPDVLLCDLEMPNIDGVEVTKSVSESYPDIKVIILSSHYESALILKMMEIGASAFMPKDEETEEFYETIINVIEKGFHYNDFVVKLIREKMLFGSKSKIVDLTVLTTREKEILSLICEQKTNKDIGNQLFISPRTVEGHRNKLLEKTKSKNTAGLIIYAIEKGYYQVTVKNNDW